MSSLCFLYQEAARENAQELASILETAVEEVQLLDSKATYSKETTGLLKQFIVLRGFQKMSQEQKELFIRQVEGFEQNVIHWDFA